MDDIRAIRVLALTGLSDGEYKAALAAIVEVTGRVISEQTKPTGLPESEIRRISRELAEEGGQ